MFLKPGDITNLLLEVEGPGSREFFGELFADRRTAKIDGTESKYDTDEPGAFVGQAIKAIAGTMDWDEIMGKVGNGVSIATANKLSQLENDSQNLPSRTKKRTGRYLEGIAENADIKEEDQNEVITELLNYTFKNPESAAETTDKFYHNLIDDYALTDSGKVDNNNTNLIEANKNTTSQPEEDNSSINPNTDKGSDYFEDFELYAEKTEKDGKNEEINDASKKTAEVTIKTQKRPTAAEIDVVARTIYGEFPRHKIKYQELMVWVMRNRLNYSKKWPTLDKVAKDASQFSCWLENDSNNSRVLNPDKKDPRWQRALSVAKKVLESDESKNPIPDIYNYYSPRSMKPTGKVPTWARGQEAISIPGIKSSHMTLIKLKNP